VKKKQPLNSDILIFLAIAFCAVISFPAIAPHLKGLSFMDVFGVVTGGIALLLTFYQMYNGIVKDRTESLEDEIDDVKKFFTGELDEGNNLCRERFDNQQQTLKYLLERVNNLTVDVKSHEQLHGHVGTSADLSTIREELTQVRAVIAITSQKSEILNRLNNLESQQGFTLIQGGIESTTTLSEETS
jgi:methionine synthase II (cobalamin-independent)